jgi:hypothetical protein
MHWWLPNEEHYPQIVRSIRKFVEERSSPANDVPTEDLRDMKAIFSTMKLDDAEPKSGISLNSAGKSKPTNLAFAMDAPPNFQDMTGMVDDSSYGLGFENQQREFWDETHTNGQYRFNK